MTEPTPQNDRTIAQIVQLLRQMSEGDRLRVVNFIENILVLREAKRDRRRRRFVREPDQRWQIGN